MMVLRPQASAALALVPMLLALGIRGVAAKADAASAGAAMSCAEQKARGADAGIREIVGLVFNTVGVWILGASLLLCCLAPVICKYWSRIVNRDLKRRFYFEGEYQGWQVQTPEVGCPAWAEEQMQAGKTLDDLALPGWQVQTPLADPRAWAEEQMKAGKTLDDLPLPVPLPIDDDHPYGHRCEEDIYNYLLVPLAITASPFACLLLLPLVIVIAFPVLAKLKLFHLERAIVLCLPVPQGGPDIPLSTYVLPLYAGKTAYDLFGIYTKRWKAPSETSVGPVLVIQEWLALQVFDVYTDGSSLASMAGHVPLWYFGQWVFTSVASISVVIAGAAWFSQGSMTEQRFFALLLIQLVAEDIPQLVLSALTLMLTSLDLNLNQYMVYNMVGNFLSCATLAKKLALDRGSHGYHFAQLDEVPSEEFQVVF